MFHARCQIVNRDLLGAVAPDQRHRAPEGGVRVGHVGDVNHQHIHADRADDRSAPPADQDAGIANVARVTVGIPHR